MGEVPTTVNGTANSVNGIINFTVFGLAVTAFKTYARAEAPFLNAPIVSEIFDYLMDKVGSFFYAYLSQVATFTIIDLQTASERNAYYAAEGKLRAAHLTGDEHAIDAATEDFKKAFQSLIHWDGSSSNTAHG